MAKYSRIEWTDATWSPVTGCAPISEGCQNCYARRMANRLRGRCGYPKENPFKVTLHPERLDEPLKWRKPRKVFVCSMSDLFHPDVPFHYISNIFDIMCSWRWPNKEAERIGDESLLEDPGHTYMVLTKRPERVQDWLQWLFEYWPGDSPVNVNLSAEGHFGRHIWFGVTAENQQRADERIPILLQIPAAVRFVSVEPMLGPVDLSKWLGGTWYCETCECTVDPEFVPFSEIHYPCENYLDFIPGIDWVICGGETGPGARPMHPDWVRSLVLQCKNAGVPFFFKQHGEWLHETQGIDFHEGHKYYVWPDESMSFRVGKKAAGRILDGRTWDEMPEI